MNRLSNGITELSLNDINTVSGGHNPSVRQLHEENGVGPVPANENAVAALSEEKLPPVTSHGGWGRGGING